MEDGIGVLGEDIMSRVHSLSKAWLVPFVEVLFEKLGRPDKELVIYTEKPRLF